MAYIVKCPECGEVNGGSQLRCVKCQASLIGIPREDDGSSVPEPVKVEAGTTEEKPVRNIDQMARISFSMLVLAVLVSPYVTAQLANLLGRKHPRDCGQAFSLISAALCGVGLVLAINASKRAKGENTLATLSAALGIMLSILDLVAIYVLFFVFQ